MLVVQWFMSARVPVDLVASRASLKPSDTIIATRRNEPTRATSDSSEHYALLEPTLLSMILVFNVLFLISIHYAFIQFIKRIRMAIELGLPLMLTYYAPTRYKRLLLNYQISTCNKFVNEEFLLEAFFEILKRVFIICLARVKYYVP